MQYPYISMYSRSKPASTHSTALDATVGERSRKQKISDLRTSPGPLWRLHTWFDLFSLPTRSAAGSRVDDDRRCRSPQLGFTTSQPRGCIRSSAPRTGLREAVRQSPGRCHGQPFGRTFETRMVTRTALREDLQNSDGHMDSPSGGTHELRPKLRSLYREIGRASCRERV